MTATNLVDENRRLAALAECKILDTPDDPVFNALVSLVARHFSVPIALVSLVDANRLWCKATHGQVAREMPRVGTFCSYAVNHHAESAHRAEFIEKTCPFCSYAGDQPAESGNGAKSPEKTCPFCSYGLRYGAEPLVVEDATRDPRFATHPLVTGQPPIVFYAGVPLRLSNGHSIGTLCLMDHAPRTFPAAQREELVLFAGQAVSLITLHALNQRYQAELAGHRATERALRRSEADYRQLFERIPLPMWVYDRKTLKFLAVNTAAVTHYGYAREDFMRHTIKDIRPEAEIPRLLDRLSALPKLPTGPQPCGRWQHRRADGSVIIVETIADDIRWDGRAARIVLASDISERLRAEERFELLARATSDALWDWNLAVGTVWLSVGFKAQFGHPEGLRTDAAAFRDPHIHPDDRARVLDKWERTLARSEESTWACEYRFQHRDGTYLWVADHGYIVREGGRPRRIVGGLANITEKKNLETQYLRTQRMESIGTLAGGIAHDLNNILTPILMSTDLLRGHVFSGEGLETVAGIEKSAHRGANLVRQILAFNRGVSVEKAPVSLEHIIREQQQIIAETFPRSIRLRVEIDPELWPVVGDATHLHQVLLNLCVNARDAMPRGGEMFISARNATLGERVAPGSSSPPHGPFVALAVADTGTGIPHEISHRIFEPFFTTKSSGSGLGLSTVHAIVKSHGGFIDVQSEVGHGTRFIVHLPADPVAAAREARGEATPPRGAGELILIIDDEENIRGTTRRMLEKYGYRVLTAGDGREAIEVFAAHAPQIAAVVTDFMMPGMDGLTAVRAIFRRHARVPVILTSGFADRVDLANLGRESIHYLSKPYPAEQLLRWLKKALASGGHART
jgi:PAS domain S-box-containing protein